MAIATTATASAAAAASLADCFQCYIAMDYITHGRSQRGQCWSRYIFSETETCDKTPLLRHARIRLKHDETETLLKCSSTFKKWDIAMVSRHMPVNHTVLH